MTEPTHNLSESAEAGAAKPPGPRPRRRIRRVVWLTLALGVLGLFGRYSFLRITRRPTPRDAYWEARLIENSRRSGLTPTMTWDDTVKLFTNLPWTPHVQPPSSMRFAAVVPDSLEGKWDLSRPDIAFVDEQLRSAEFRAARDALASAAVDGWQEPVFFVIRGRPPYVHEYSVWHNWLLADARRAVAVDEDWQRAAVDWMTCCRLARQELQHRVAFTTHYACYILDDTAREMGLAADEGEASLSTRVLAEQIDSILGPMEKPSELLSGQRLIDLHRVDCCFVADGGWLDVSTAVEFDAGCPEPSRLWNLTSFVFNDAENARRKIDAHYAKLDASQTLEDHWKAERSFILNRQQPVLNVVDGCRANYAWCIMRSAVSDYFEARMNLDASVAMLALSSYHKTHGRYPERLEQLVPQYLHRLPIDYADLQPLRYKPTATGYQLYSLGPDGRDDAGTAFDERVPCRTASRRYDIVYSDRKRREHYEAEAP